MQDKEVNFEDFFEEVVEDESSYDSMICTHNCD